MLQLPLDKLITGIVRNQAHRFNVPAILRAVMKMRPSGGVRWSRRSTDEILKHILYLFELFRPHVGDCTGKVGLEIGPGDNIGVAYSFLRSGCRRMYAVERFPSIVFDKKAETIFEELDRRFPVNPEPIVSKGRIDPDRFQLIEQCFEDVCALDCPEALDFIYSNDVLEHVDDVLGVFRKAHELLKPGGLFINNIDFTGHNVFSNRKRPLDFLTCPEFLWGWMFSHVVTTNRLRFFETLEYAKAAGFKLEGFKILHRADPKYIENIRKHLLPQYRQLSAGDLTVLQCVLVVRK